jgi:hypothetical protein
MGIDANKVKAELEAETAAASAKWGVFRKWLSAHPLTGFWGALILGVVVGYLVGLV